MRPLVAHRAADDIFLSHCLQSISLAALLFTRRHVCRRFIRSDAIYAAPLMSAAAQQQRILRDVRRRPSHFCLHAAMR